MRQAILLSGLIFFAEQAFSQAKDTVRNNIDYRNKQRFFQEDEGNTVRTNHNYFSLQANQLLRQLFSFSNTNTNVGNPFVFNYAINNKQTGNGVAFGLGHVSSHVEDSDQGIDRETDNSTLNFRVGYDKKISIGKRWTAGWGVDFLLSRSKSFTRTDQFGSVSKIDEKANGWGLGPRGVLLFQVNEKVHLGTETSWYFQKETIESEITFSGGGDSTSDQDNSSFALQVPVAIFLTLRF